MRRPLVYLYLYYYTALVWKRVMTMSGGESEKKAISILVVEDDGDAVILLSGIFEANGFRVVCAASGEEGLAALARERVKLALLDIRLPDMLGFEVLTRIRSNPLTKSLPVIITSQVDEEEEIVRALNLGADDYLTKPYSSPILIARVQSVLRRAEQEKGNEDIVAFEGLSLDLERFVAAVDGSPVDLGLSEFRILHTLMSKRGKVLTRDQIIEAVHGEKYPVTDRSVDVQIVGLRKKLGPYANLVETVRGIGYRFSD